MTARVHITGGSGSGTTTLGAHLARALDASHMDTDDFFWLPTDPPYTDKRDVPERLALMEQLFLARDRWVLSGSVMGWGDPLIPLFDLVVRLEITADDRVARLRTREQLAYGDRIKAGGDMYQVHLDFIEWASGYDAPDFSGRSRKRHANWCADLACPVLVLDSTRPVDELVRDCLARLNGDRRTT